jgi:trk system potassium uptake protein TrkA
MKILICGVGKITRHLLHRLGEGWQVTLVDKSEERLNSLVPTYRNIQKIFAGDASSPVTLDDVGVADFEYVLALTDNDKVNLATAKYAGSQGVPHVLALVNEQENQPKFQELGVRAVLGSTLLAKRIYHYLQDPRINVTPLSLGEAEVMEIDVSHHSRIVGMKASTLASDDWRLVGIFRQNKLFFPDELTTVEVDDRLVVFGGPDLYKPVCTLLECGDPHFPLAYGQGLLLALEPDGEPEQIIKESMHLVQNTKVRHLTVLCAQKECNVQEQLAAWSPGIDFQVRTAGGDFLGELRRMAAEENYGVVVVHPLEASFFKKLTKPVMVSLAHSLSCPLLVARHTHPYERVLVPFNATAKAELALGIAVDLARQLTAEIAVAVVDEPEIIRGPQEEDWAEAVLQRVRELAHIHKMEFEEIARKGNPVNEIVELARDFNLMVLGSTTKEKGLFSPHVGELLARKAPCSVLIVAK